MIRYLLKRSYIALKERKFWFAFIIFPVLSYSIYLFWFSGTYSISARIVFELKDSEKRTGYSDKVLWGGITSLLNSKQSFLQAQVPNIPIDLLDAVISDYREENSRGLQDSFKNSSIQKARTVILNRLSISTESTSYAYWLTYRGDDKSLGLQLLSFYSKRLVESLGHLADSRSTQGMSDRHRSGKGSEKKKIAFHAIQKVKKSIIPGVNNPNDETRFYRILAEYISTAKHSPPGVTSKEMYVAHIIVSRLVFVILLSIALIALIAIIAGFNSPSFNSEYQVARYLDIPIIGSLPGMHSLDK